MSRYPDPDAPGFRAHAVGGTSQAAAEVVAKSSRAMSADIYALLEQAPSTSEELARKLQRPGERRVLVSSVRARVCGLRAQGRVVASGDFGVGESGHAKVVRWRRSTPAELEAFKAAGGQAPIRNRKRPLTEAQVRRIVREEMEAAGSVPPSADDMVARVMERAV